MSKISKLIKNPISFIKDCRLFKAKENRSLINDKGVEVKQQVEYLGQLVRFKNNYPVNEIKYGEKQVWPYLRNELMIQLNVAWMRQIKNEQNFNPYLSQLCRPSNIKIKDRAKLVKKKNFFEVDDITSEKLDFIFFTNLNSADHVEINGKYFNRILDPIYEEALKKYKVKKIEIIKSFSKSIEKISNYTHKPLCVIPPKLHTLGYYQNIYIRDDFFSSYKSNISYVPINENRMNSFFDWQINMKNFYKRILLKFNPKAVFFHPYYYYTPLVHAANELGIKTVDVQHGLQFGYNPVFYSDWQESPKRGYDLLPSHFWVWGEKEKGNIEETFKGKGTIVGGYPWLDRQLKFTSDDKHISFLKKKKSKYKYVALICLQIKAELPIKVEEMIKDTESEVLWLIRKHPKGESVKELSSSLRPNVIYGHAVDKPVLGRLFEIVDLHFSSGSTTLIEADYYGVYSYIFGNEGRENFKDEIKNGTIGDIDYFNDFKALKHKDKCKNRPSINHFKKADVNSMLELF